MNCRRCQRPQELHCPGCNTCWPDHACSPFCDADPDTVVLIAAAVDEWEEAHQLGVAS